MEQTAFLACLKDANLRLPRLRLCAGLFLAQFPGGGGLAPQIFFVGWQMP